ncbi:MAG: alpha-amylase family glycosyl hydrolase [Paludibacteraceae bacterium]|nr:alpha-amylase family glycosyl hydrolase [Paludibacteraceae bacterium]
MKKLFLLLSAFAALPLFAQSFTPDQVNQCYSDFGDNVTFIFDEGLYGMQPQRVFVTGEFRSWDASTTDTKWDLKKVGNQWVLSFDNTDESVIKSNSQFKFRTNDGDWIDPWSGAPNQKNGNLVFKPQAEVFQMRAELKLSGNIWAEIGDGRTTKIEDYRLTDANGKEIKIAGVMPNGAKTTLITPAEPIDIRRVYYLEFLPLKQKAFCSYDGWFREIYSAKELGANVDDNVTTFRVFAPRATLVVLYLYNDKNDSIPTIGEYEMKKDADGVWEYSFDKDLAGVWYDFTAHGFRDPGNRFYETHPVHINDPYARVSDDTFGKCRVWHRTVPATPLAKGIPAMQDVISYEVHVQDFTDKLPLPDSLKGTMKGMITSGLKNKKGEAIGFDYLVDLGINTVHLQPMQEYLHIPDAEWQEAYQNDSFMIAQGIANENYQWGYRTSFAMAVESRYRVKGSDNGSERDQFRDLVQAFHDKGIAVIIDLVPNHTAEDMEGHNWNFNFNGFDKQYYYRTKNFEHIGGYGNEVKTENRPMTQRWLIDQCMYFINEFGIDGFRIDLAGQMDQQTLKTLKETIGYDKILYGEPWIGSNDPDYENNPDWDWYKEDAPICYFQDESRNAYKGATFDLKDPKTDRGWAGGKFSERANVMKGLTCTYKEDKNPCSGITYLDIHDNFALADQFGGADFDGRTHVDQKEYKIAATLMYTTLGPIVCHGGSEIMRSKAHAPMQEIVKHSKNYNFYYHGYRDSYNCREANDYQWEQVGQKPNKENKNDYANMLAFWKGLNKLRNSEYGNVFRQGEAVPEDYYKWFAPADNESVLGYMVDNKVLVLINGGDFGYTFNVKLPQGNWKLVGTIDEINLEGVKAKNKTLKDFAGTGSLMVEGKGMYIFINAQDEQ